MKRILLVGATGYGGVGLIELVGRHPAFEFAALVANRETGRPVSEVWPHLRGFCDLVVHDADSPGAAVEADAVVFATPDRVGQERAAPYVEAGRKVVDYSGDFRFGTPPVYAEYARRLGIDTAHLAPGLLAKSAYGLPELHREAIRAAQIVGNPGCFAVACILGLAPAAREGLLEPAGLVCDCKTGVSGAGKKPRPGFHYPEQYDATYAYRLGGHQHVMEVERELSLLAGTDLRLTFTPQVVPMTRGILAGLYGRLATGTTQERVLEAYRAFYAGEPFVEVIGPEESASTGHVRGSNRVKIQVACDERTGAFRVLSHIDNLVKGQAGNALQNLNLLFGFEETLGLDQPGAHP